MKLTKLVAIAFILGSASASALSAQSVSGRTPAEFPPSSYKGKQYVDSNGCVFIRAGIDGNVSWIARMTRARKGVCGFKPTFAGEVTPAPQPVQTAEVKQITNPAPAARPTPVAAAPKPKPQPKPRRVATAAPKPKPQPKVVRQVAQRPAPIVEKTVQYQAPVMRTQRVAQAGATACPNASAVGSRYMRPGKYAVRCGPQTAPIVGSRISSAPTPRTTTVYAQQRDVASADAPIRVSPNRRIVPRHVAVKRVNTNNVQVPHGYKRVWEDDRLNPKRAEQSLAGHQAMTMIWTSTVPRRLINQADGQDVTASVPLVYPYTDYAAQQRELGQVTIVKRNGQTLKRIVRNVTSIVSPEPTQARVKTVQRAATYSTRSAPKVAPQPTVQRAPTKAAVAGRGYVQVGKFTDAVAAQSLAQRVQRMGIPVRVGVYNSKDQANRLVIAGPFSGQKDVKRAINRLRSAGFNATAR